MSQQPPGPPPGHPPRQPMPPAPAGGGADAGGPTDAQGRPLAEWWKRLVAAIIDAVIITIPYYILLAVLGLGFAASDEITIDRETGEITGGETGFIAAFFISWL